MYIYYGLFFDALSAYMIHINLNTIFYTHVEHSPTETVYIKYYMEKKRRKKRKEGMSADISENVSDFRAFD